jgi:hypothetical protein
MTVGMSSRSVFKTNNPKPWRKPANMHRRPRFIALFAGLCLLGACANHSFAPGPGKSASDYTPDSAKCRLFARGVNPGFDFEASGSPKFVAESTAGAAIVYGITTAIITNQNYNDCMQANGWLIADGAQPAPAPMFDQTLADGRVGVSAQPLAATLTNAPTTPRRPLGVRVMAVPDEMTGWLHVDSTNGLFVLDVEPGALASASGIKSGDVLLTLADVPIATPEDIKVALASVHSHDTVVAVIWRKGQEQSVSLQF